MYHISNQCRYACMTDALTRVSGRAGKQFVSYWNKILNVYKETPQTNYLCSYISVYKFNNIWLFHICNLSMREPRICEKNHIVVFVKSHLKSQKQSTSLSYTSTVIKFEGKVISSNEIKPQQYMYCQ